MNKYQEALNYIKDYIDVNGDLQGDDNNIAKFNRLNIDTIQGLLDELFSIKVDGYEFGDYSQYENLNIDELRDTLYELLDNYNELLEKFNLQNSAYATRLQYSFELKERLMKSYQYIKDNYCYECTNDCDNCKIGQLRKYSAI